MAADDSDGTRRIELEIAIVRQGKNLGIRKCVKLELGPECDATACELVGGAHV